MGSVNTAASSLGCTSCIYPAYTLAPGTTSCSAFCICLPIWALALVSVLLALFFIGGAIATGEKAPALIALTIMPALNTISNALYMLETNFYSPTLFALVVLFHFLPDAVLFYRMYTLGVLAPGFHIPRPAVMTDGTLFWLWYDEKGYPTQYCKRLSCTFERHDTLMKVMSFWLVWLASVAVQVVCVLVYALLYLPYLALHAPFWCAWILVGCYCYHVKAMAIGKVWSAWFRVWLNSDKMESHILVDTDIMNQGIFVHFVLETLPQIFIQTISEF